MPKQIPSFIGQDGVTLDTHGDLVATKYVNAYRGGEHTITMKLHQGEMIEDGVLLPARTITLGHDEAVKLRSALNTWIKDPDRVIIHRDTIDDIISRVELIPDDEDGYRSGILRTLDAMRNNG